MGTVTVVCTMKATGRQQKCTFHVVDRSVKTLLGLKDCLRLELVVLDNMEVHMTSVNEDLFAEYHELFDGKLGKLPVEYKMKLKPDVPPVARPPHRVPINMQDRVK